MFQISAGGFNLKSSLGIYSVKQYGAHSTTEPGYAAFDSTAAIALALAAVPSYGTLYFPPGIWRGSLSIRRNDITIAGAGMGKTTIKLNNGAIAATNVLELGFTAWTVWPPPTYDNITVRDITLDGNRANTNDPFLTHIADGFAEDVRGWGLPITYCTNCNISNVRAINCWFGGIGQFINSDGCHFTDITAYNCGYTAYGGGANGFDINSSKYSTYDGIIIDTCKYGLRILDNCVGLNYSTGLNLSAVIKDAVQSGFNYSAHSGNLARSNNIVLNIVGGCGDYGIGIGGDVRSSHIKANIYNITGIGLYVTDVTTPGEKVVNNVFDIITDNCGLSGAQIYQDHNIYRIHSYMDGRLGPPGAVHAVYLYGNYNQLEMTVIDTGTPQVRGLYLGGIGNDVISYKESGTVQYLNDAGIDNTLHPRTLISESAAPIAGTAKIGDIIWNSIPISGQPAGWMCTHSGTFSAATDNTGDTDGVTGVITGMTDTSDFTIGDYVDVSAGFPTTGPYGILSKTTTTITIDTPSNAIANNITVDTSDPIWTAMANLA